MNQPVRYLVRIIKRGPNLERFGWAICRQDNLLEVQRSTEIFETRTEALLDSVRAAQLLAFSLTIDILGLNCKAARLVASQPNQRGNSK
jgi:hypothetical protein